MSPRDYSSMNVRLQGTAERQLLRQLRKRVRAIWLLTPLVLGGLMVWAPLHVDGQVFGINLINNISVLAGTPISIQVSVTNTTAATSVLFWTLSSNPTTDASIAPTNTAPQGTTTFSWTPTEAQVVTFTVAVTQFGTLNVAATSFIVTVTNSTTAGTPPYLALPFSTTTNITLGTTLTFTAFATNTDGSGNALTFSLDPIAAAAGATITTINSTSGLFQWTPTVGGRYDNLQVIVTEAVTSLSATQAFSVDVLLTNNCAQLDQFLAAVQHGGYFPLSNCTTIVLTNTLTISNSVTLDAGTNNVTISGNNLFRLFTVLPGVTNFTLSGLTISGGKDPNGGCLYINQGATVVLTNCTFSGNGAAGAGGVAGAVGSSGGVNGGNGGRDAGGGSALGGAIYNLGSLTALGCQFLTNSAAGGSGRSEERRVGKECRSRWSP